MYVSVCCWNVCFLADTLKGIVNRFNLRFVFVSLLVCTAYCVVNNHV